MLTLSEILSSGDDLLNFQEPYFDSENNMHVYSVVLLDPEGNYHFKGEIQDLNSDVCLENALLCYPQDSVNRVFLIPCTLDMLIEQAISNFDGFPIS